MFHAAYVVCLKKKECVVHMLTFLVLKSGDSKQMTKTTTTGGSRAGGWWCSHTCFRTNEGLLASVCSYIHPN